MAGRCSPPRRGRRYLLPARRLRPTARAVPAGHGACRRGGARAAAGRPRAGDPGRDPLRLSRGRAAAGRAAPRPHRPARARRARCRGAGPGRPGAGAGRRAGLRAAGRARGSAHGDADPAGAGCAGARGAGGQARARAAGRAGAVRLRAGGPPARDLPRPCRRAPRAHPRAALLRAHRAAGPRAHRPGRGEKSRGTGRRGEPRRVPGLARPAGRPGRPVRAAGGLHPVRPARPRARRRPVASEPLPGGARGRVLGRGGLAPPRPRGAAQREHAAGLAGGRRVAHDGPRAFPGVRAGPPLGRRPGRAGQTRGGADLPARSGVAGRPRLRPAA